MITLVKGKISPSIFEVTYISKTSKNAKPAIVHFSVLIADCELGATGCFKIETK